MNSRLSLLRNLALLGAVALSAPLLTPRTAAAAAECISQDFGDGSFCVGCRSGNCWAAVCYDSDYNEYSDGGCSAGPRPPSYA
jgi:hypothetical protein